MTPRSRRTLAGSIAALALGLGAWPLTDGAPSGKASPRDEAQAAATAFLDRYVGADGRVVRRDQGDDTVSEGQAYAMLLAVAVRDRTRFAVVWRWTVDNLQRADGLLSWHWADGVVQDAMPATDADLDAARALAMAAEVFHDAGYRLDAQRLATAILDGETQTVGGRLVVLAGPWARSDGTTAAVLNPSYFSPRTYELLAALSGDVRWSQLRDSSMTVVDTLAARSLPPDWATIDATGAIRAAPSPRGTPPGYGQDAARIPVRLAEDCAAEGRRRAALLWPRLRFSPHRSTLGWVAAAAAADAAGDTATRDVLLERAQASQATTATYYGAAWLALGRTMLETDLLGTCPGG